MRERLGRDERRVCDLLLPTLQAAVPEWMFRLRGTDEWQRVALAREDAAHIAAHGDALMYPAKHGEGAKAITALARGIAIGAYQPGGITVFGQHWCTDHDVCTGAKPVTRPGPDPTPRRVVDVHLPGDGEVA